LNYIKRRVKKVEGRGEGWISLILGTECKTWGKEVGERSPPSCATVKNRLKKTGPLGKEKMHSCPLQTK